MTPRVKICCIRDEAEAALAVRHGAAAIGLVTAMPSGPGVIAEPEAARIAAGVPPGVTSVLLTSRAEAGAILEQQRRTRAGALQLCARLTPAGLRVLHECLPGIALIQVFHVTGEAVVEEAERLAPLVDALLLDTGDPRAAVPVLGGTGRVHDWTVSRRVRERVSVPVFLAGGLRAENVAEAIRTVEPYGVDLCTGVRTDGRLDESKLAAFMASVREAAPNG